MSEPKGPEAKADTKEAKADTRDTNLQVPMSAEAKKEKVIQQFPDGSFEETTVGDLAKTHGDPLGGPTTADLNPAFAPSAKAHDGAAKS